MITALLVFSIAMIFLIKGNLFSLHFYYSIPIVMQELKEVVTGFMQFFK